MKKKMIAISVAVMSVCAISFTSVNMAHATENTMEVQGHGDGHCRKCGTKNGQYRCKAFCPIKGHPTDCTCGHSKNQHAYKN